MRVWEHIAECLKERGSCALVTVAHVAGSTPREEGARMVVRADSAFYGTIGGGTLELEAIRKVAALVQKGDAVFVQQSVSLGPDLGQCCGGRARLSIEVLTRRSLGSSQALAEKEREGCVFGTSAELADGRLGERRLLDVPPARPLEFLDRHETGMVEVVERFGDLRRPLVLFGAGHVGKALVLALAPLPFSVTWVDARADQFPGPVPANVTKVHLDNPVSVLEDAPPGAFVLAMTHSHALDEEIMARALLLQKFGYCGVIGSKTKRARFLKRLKARGLDDAVVSNMVCPVGKTTIRPKHPAAIAAGIAVDLLERKEALVGRSGIQSGLALTTTLGQ